MKFSRRWLSDFLSPAGQLPDDDALAALLTARGIEIESHTATAAAAGLLVGEVLTVSPHPNAQKLSLCEVAVGKNEKATIVCGAPNVRPGQRVAVAPPGARVAQMLMQKRDIRGVTSAGMLCSAHELGIGDDAGGIMTLAADELASGAPLDDYLQFSDAVFDAKITPNRGDCLSHLGLAREIAAALNCQLQPPTPALQQQTDEIFPIEIATAACPYYGCVVIRNADAARPSPWWLRTRLQRCGLRPVGAAVDITNYVMLATGQPLHAFDLNTLSGGICVRMAATNEPLTLLDGTTVNCDADTLLIADQKQALALGGVMGGMASAVTAGTKNILLEGAFFTPTAVRGKTARYGLTSEAAYRFERGVDPTMAAPALALAADLFRQICGGQAGPLHAAGQPPPPAAPISITGESLRGIIGVNDIGTAEAAGMLTAMGIDSTANRDVIHATPPPWRFDLEKPADLVEEVVRAWGYDKLPETTPPGGCNILPLPPLPFSAAAVRRRFAALGFSEIVTYAFVSPLWEERLQAGRGTPLAIKNPINQDLSVMRTTLLGGLLDRALFNLNHRQESLRLFELGRCFIGGDINAPWQQTQPLFVAGLALGKTAPAQWGASERDSDFFDLKGWLETFLQHAEQVRFAEHPLPAFLHPHQSSGIYAAINGRQEHLGVLGVLHPALATTFGFRRPPLVFELNMELLGGVRVLPQAAEVSRFPAVRRDLSVVADAATPAQTVLACAHNAATATPVTGVTLFDRHESDNIGDGKKCYGLRLTMQGTTANLTDDDINRVLSAVTEALGAAGMALRQ